MNDMPEPWNIDRLAGYLGVSKHFVYRLTREHRIRFVKVAKELRCRPEDVAAWIESESVSPVKVVEIAPPGRAPLRRGRPRNRDRVAS